MMQDVYAKDILTKHLEGNHKKQDYNQIENQESHGELRIRIKQCPEQQIVRQMRDR